MSYQAKHVGERYDNLFAKLSNNNEGAFIPFVTIGDPDAQQSLAVIKSLIGAGADALELGIPFSDPSADGITIQMAGNRALEAGVTPDVCFDILHQVREYAPNIPIGLLLYGNLVFARGIEKFYQDVANAGVDSVLVADLPVRESAPFKAAANKANIAHIFIAPPNADDEALKVIAEHTQGYTYVLARAGVTGTVTKADTPATDVLDKLKIFKAPPTVLGFGISEPAQVKEAIASGARGAIAGSATVKIIENNLENYQDMLDKLSKFTSQMKAATK